ncbi:MAG: sigma-70 family RNA polymerase sigma factor [Blastocatellia bacterium]|nr:sigma-70 family RNA polymerase sigma factor [Blastocatellia bacterium]
MDQARKQTQKDWSPTEEAFHALLQALHPEPESAALEYEKIHRRLVKFFEDEKITVPEELADETINRVMRKVFEGTAVFEGPPVRYFVGVARNLLREEWRKPEGQGISWEDVSPTRTPRIDPLQEAQLLEERVTREQRLECLHKCLAKLSPDLREAVAEYYGDQGGLGIERRKALAAKLGIEAVNLRVRMHRLREKLEQCVSNCLKTL